jgi:hypothetical protein
VTQQCASELIEDRYPESIFVVLARLELDDFPRLFPSDLGESREQHGLSDTSESSDDHRLIRAAALQSLQQLSECRQLIVAANDEFRDRAGVCCAGIRDGIHVDVLVGLAQFTERS